jgi:large subunit ribosomal protein L24
MARIRKGDLVAVTAGADRGKRGRVIGIRPGAAPGQESVLVEGVRMVFKHLRKSQKNPQGGRIKREAWISASTVMPIDPSTDKPTRVSSAVVDGRRVRVARKSRAVIVAPQGKAGTAVPQDAPVPAREPAARGAGATGGKE